MAVRWAKVAIPGALAVVGGLLLSQRAQAEPPDPGPTQQTAYPVDDWVMTVYGASRREPLAVGYSGGHLFELSTGLILFAGLPASFRSAILRLYPMEYGDIYGVSVQVWNQEIYRDVQVAPLPIVVNITSLVTGPNLQVTLVPDLPTYPDNFLRFYGSVRGPQEFRPRIDFVL